MLDNSSLSRGVLAGFSLCQWRLDRARLLEAAGWRSDQPPHSLINQVVVKTVHLALLLVLTPPQTRYQLSSTPTSTLTTRPSPPLPPSRPPWPSLLSVELSGNSVVEQGLVTVSQSPPASPPTCFISIVFTEREQSDKYYDNDHLLLLTPSLRYNIQVSHTQTRPHILKVQVSILQFYMSST